jgi:ABC-type Fe3+/spermidine/putrescine transport system ATPase subunit
MREPLIKIRDLKKLFTQKSGYLTAIENVHMDVFDKEFLCILGPSGCG